VRKNCSTPKEASLPWQLFNYAATPKSLKSLIGKPFQMADFLAFIK
jgi:hypothetical protein